MCLPIAGWDEPARRMRSGAALSASITHSHPLGMEGAVVQARAVAEAVQYAVMLGAVPAENLVLVDTKRLARFALPSPLGYDAASQTPN